MASIQASIGARRYQTSLVSASNSYVADEPLDAGGGDTGFSPSELLASSLAACTCITLRMYADRKGWPLDDVQVTVALDPDTKKDISEISCAISLIGDLSDEQRGRLMDIAKKCPIHKTLTRPIRISTTQQKDDIASNPTINP